MIDEETKNRVLEQLKDFSNEDVKKLHAMFFDLWCWNSKAYNDMYQILSEVHREREELIRNNQCVVGNTNPTLYMDGQEVLKMSYGILELGPALEMALQDFLRKELFNSSNSYLKLEDDLRLFVSNMIEEEKLRNGG